MAPLPFVLTLKGQELSADGKAKQDSVSTLEPAMQVAWVYPMLVVRPYLDFSMCFTFACARPGKCRDGVPDLEHWPS
jgi:hypothetical protein